MNRYRCRRNLKRKEKEKQQTTVDTLATRPFSTTSPCEPSLYLLHPLEISAVHQNHLHRARLDKGKDSHPFKAFPLRITETVEMVEEEERHQSLLQFRLQSRGRLRSKEREVQLVNEEVDEKNPLLRCNVPLIIVSCAFRLCCLHWYSALSASIDVCLASGSELAFLLAKSWSSRWSSELLLCFLSLTFLAFCFSASLLLFLLRTCIDKGTVE